MEVKERELIAGLFDRLQPFESQPRDAEAAALIADLVRRQPAAPYLLTQTVLVQEQALKAAQERIAELEGKAGGAASSGFLSSAPKIGPWGSKPSSAVPQTTASAMAPPAPGGAPDGAWASGGGGGSFLRNAMATAAGVAGGALLFQGISSLINRQPGPFAGQPQGERLLGSDNAADLAQDEGAADDYNLTDDTSGFDDGGGGDFS
jgi:hypothetical protein